MSISNDKKTYYFLDILKLFFACMIPILHMRYGGGPKLSILQEYIARLGVPFFFTVTGFLLERKLRENCSWSVGKAFIKRAAILLGVWAIIDLPIHFFLNVKYNESGEVLQFVKEVFFETPGFLWYLTALIVGEALYCLLRINLKLSLWKVMIICAVLYVVGTLCNSWDIITNLCPDWYENIFITTRNGLFFAPFMLCAGALLNKEFKLNQIWAFVLMIASLAIFVLEVHFIRSHVTGEFDSSMYFSLPLVEFFIIKFAMGVNVSEKLHGICKIARKLSVVIYCSQFVCISIGFELFFYRLGKMKYILVTYVILFVFSALLTLLIEKSKIKWLKNLD